MLGIKALLFVILFLPACASTGNWENSPAKGILTQSGWDNYQAIEISVGGVAPFTSEYRGAPIVEGEASRLGLGYERNFGDRFSGLMRIESYKLDNIEVLGARLGGRLFLNPVGMVAPFIYGEIAGGPGFEVGPGTSDSWLGGGYGIGAKWFMTPVQALEIQLGEEGFYDYIGTPQGDLTHYGNSLRVSFFHYF